MRNYQTAIVIVSSLITALSVASAEEANLGSGLTLNQAVSEGLQEAPSLKIYQSAKDVASANQLLGMSAILPHVEIGAQHDFTAQYETVPVALGTLSAAVPEVHPRTSVGASATWIVFDGLANIQTLSASQDLSQASELEYSRKSFETRKKIQLAFFNALAAQRFEEVAEENVKTLQEAMNQVKNRLAGGVATQYDVLRVEVRLSDANTDLERMQDNVIIERKKLAEAMGKTDDNRSLDGQLPVPSSAEKIKGLKIPSVEDREDFKATQLKFKAADKQAAASTGKLVPAIGLSADYLKYENTDYPGEAYGGFRDAYSVGVFLKWSLFDGGESIAKARAAHAQAEQSAQVYQQQILSLPADFELWRRRYVYSQHHFEAKNQDLKRSEESYRIAGLASQQGRKTITDVLEAETDLFRARAGVVQSQLDAEEALVKLELTLGKDLTL